MDDAVADRAEQQPGEAAAAAGADDDQGRVLAGGCQGLDGFWEMAWVVTVRPG